MIYYINESVSKRNFQYNNIVFDFGGVLLGNSKAKEQEVIDYLISLGIDENDIRPIIILYYKAIQQDENLTREEDMEIFHNKLLQEYPQYAELSDEIFNAVTLPIALYDHDFKIMKYLKRKGYHIYYLSNVSKFKYEMRIQNKDFNKLVKYFDGGVNSFEVKVQKPDIRIYKIFLKKYKLNPSECLFFDDKEENIQSAIDAGMNGYWVDRLNRDIMVKYIMENL